MIKLINKTGLTSKVDKNQLKTNICQKMKYKFNQSINHEQVLNLYL
jgi:hypothetical protein